MYVNDLAQILRDAGLTVYEMSGWQGHNHGSLNSVRSVICHHTAGSATGNAPSLATVTNGRSDLAGPLSNIFLARNGDVYVVSNGVCWHAGPTIDDNIYGNSNSLGIEAENTGKGEPWPAEQITAYAKVCAALVKRYNIPVSRVQGHKEICAPRGRKIDPAGIPGDMNGLRALVQQYVSGAINRPTYDDNEEYEMLAKAAGDDYIAVPANGKTLLYIAASMGRHVDIIESFGVGDTRGNEGGNITYRGTAGRIDGDRPGPLAVAPGTRFVMLRYSADHDFTVWCA